MISAQSTHNIEHAFHEALRGTVVHDPGDRCEIAPLTAGEARQFTGQNALVITISSWVFRLLVIFRISADPATRQYYLRANPAQRVDEGFGEVANLCAGALNRTLTANFAHLAMSTPYELSNDCIAFLGELRAQQVSRFAITINGSVRLQATLCMCCSRPVEVASVSTAAQGDRNSGELELF